MFGLIYLSFNLMISGVGNVGKTAKTDYLDELQQYITENRLSSSSYDELYEWTNGQRNVYLMLIKDGQIIFDSDYASSTDLIPEIRYDTALIEDLQSVLYDVTLADGTAQAFIIVLLGYGYYQNFFIADILLSLMVFLLIFVSPINRNVKYIKRLKADVELMEGGIMSKPIEIYGQNELTDLAKGLEQMRLSLNENLRTEQQLTIANRNLITGMSHDLRTPLTSLLMYLEILRSHGNLSDEDTRYLNKAYNKAMQLKHLSDQLFEFFLVSRESDAKQEPPRPIKSVLTDYLSELTLILTQQGFRVDNRLEWQDAEISVRHDFLSRIMDNIISNLLKYADREKKIVISTVSYDGLTGIKFSNCISPNRGSADSTGIGVTNIRLMMNSMGEYRISESKSLYESELLFHIK